MVMPFVSRGTLLAVESERNRLLARVATVEASHAQLVAELLVMRREGFTAAPTAPTAPPERKSLPREIDDALDEVGFQGSGRSQMETWAWRQLEKDRDVSVVASEIRTGEKI